MGLRIARDAEQGEHIHTLMERYWVTDRVVRYWCEQHGIIPISCRCLLPKSWLPEVIDMSVKGATQTQIGSLLGLSRQRIHQLVKRAESQGLLSV